MAGHAKVTVHRTIAIYTVKYVKQTSILANESWLHPPPCPAGTQWCGHNVLNKGRRWAYMEGWGAWVDPCKGPPPGPLGWADTRVPLGGFAA